MPRPLQPATNRPLREARLLSPPCLRTGREGSLHPAQASQRPCEGPVSMKKPAGYTIRDSSRCPYGEGSTSGTIHRHLQHLLYRFLRGSRAETPQGSQPACASGDVATRIRPMTGWPSLFPTPLPALPLVGLTTSLPPVKEQYGLTTFHKVDTKGLGALSPPKALRVHDRVFSRPCTRSSALLAQACQHLGLGAHHDVYRAFTCVHHTLHPAPSPPDAGRYTAPLAVQVPVG